MQINPLELECYPSVLVVDVEVARPEEGMAAAWAADMFIALGVGTSVRTKIFEEPMNDIHSLPHDRCAD